MNQTSMPLRAFPRFMLVVHKFLNGSLLQLATISIKQQLVISAGKKQQRNRRSIVVEISCMIFFYRKGNSDFVVELWCLVFWGLKTTQGPPA